MATVPKATTRVSDTAGALASGLDVLCVWSPCATSADMVPRLFGNATDVYTRHGYCEGVEYVALHAEQTGKPVLFCGMPITTLGAVSRKNTTGNTGSSVVTITAGGAGVLGEHDGKVTVLSGGTVGTDQIVLGLWLDGGVGPARRVRLGTANSYALPYVNVTLAFAAGTLVTGDTIATWHGSAPLTDSASMATARGNLAAQQKGFRSILLCGDAQTHTDAANFNTQLNAYETANERFVYGRMSLLDRLPLAAMARTTVRMTGNPALTFAEVGASGDTITRATGSFLADGFVPNDVITIAGSASNNVTGQITGVTATVLTMGTTDLTPEGPVTGITIVGTAGITFAEVGASGDTITRSRGSWIDDGFRVNDLIIVAGTVSNNFTAAQGLAAVTATVLTLGTDDLAAEVIGASAITVTAGQTKAAWMSALDADFSVVDAAPRIDLAAGRGRVLSPFSGWSFRRSAAWAASLREYQHDLHIATWRKSDGPTGFDLFDFDGNLVEWDDRADGGAGSAARFTTLRTWGNGPLGAFITQSLTREVESSLRSQTHNTAVVNLVQTIVQLNTETAAIGVSGTLNKDGTATATFLATMAARVNNALQLQLLTSRGEGPRVSSVLWVPSTTDVLNVPNALLTYVTRLNLNGTIHDVSGSIRIATAGQ